jgi:hypothetical protein
MKKNYVHYQNITRDVLDTIKVGDLIKVNNWKKPMRVKAVSNNYFVMTRKQFGDTYYSVCSKLPWEGAVYNGMRGGMFHCSTDNYIFGSPLSFDYPRLYKFENIEANQKYLQQFENGECELSVRRGLAIYDLYIKTT